MRHSRHLLTFALLLVLVAAKSQEVTFSAPGGFYDKAFSLTLSCNQHDKVIHFTTNGNTPTANDRTYASALFLDQSLYSQSDIYTLRNCPEEAWWCPPSVSKCIVIRAAAFNTSGERVSNVVTNSYFIKELGCDTHGLPAMSLCLDSLSLFDYHTGIFVPGVHYAPENPEHSGNYYQTGREWERPCNVEFYERQNTGINQQAGVRTHGNSTRRFAQKGLKIYAREEYGKKRFKYKFFDDTDINSFKHLKIKPFQGGWLGIGCQDYLCGRMAKGLNFPSLSSRPMVLFLNGEYWGIYFLQEKPDERYLEDHFDADLDQLNLINTWEGEYEYGDNANYLRLLHWIEANDLSDEENYRYLNDLIDVDNFIDYQIFEIFSANPDWPVNNMRCWQEGNGLWRWLFFDGDGCFLLCTDEFDALANATYDGDKLYPTSAQSTLFFRKLMENDTFRARFLSRFYHLMKSEFNYSNTQKYHQEIHDVLIEEIPRQVDRFNYPASVDEWTEGMKKVDQFLWHRATDIDPSLQKRYVGEKMSIESIYPNPAQHLIHVEVNSEDASIADFVILSPLGQRLYLSKQVVGNGITTVTIHLNLDNGVYFLKAGSSVQKFTVIN